MALSTLLLDQETTISDILKFEGKPKNEDEEYTWLQMEENQG